METEQTQTQATEVDTKESAIVDFEGAIDALDALDTSTHPIPDESQDSQAEPEAQSEPDADVTDQAEMPETYTVKDLAASLQADPAEIYKSLQIDMGNGESISLGDLKDKGKDLVRVEEMRNEVLTKESEVNADLMQKNQVLQRRMAQAGMQVTEEDLAQHQAELNQYRELQNRIITELEPDYANEAFRQQFDSMVTERLDSLGVPEAEKALISSGWLRLELYQHQKLLQEIKGVRARKVSNKRNQRPKTSTKSSITISDKVKSGQMSQDEALSQLAKSL